MHKDNLMIIALIMIQTSIMLPVQRLDSVHSIISFVPINKDPDAAVGMMIKQAPSNVITL